MSTAPTLPPREEWTVDDLAELPRDLSYELVNGRLIVPSPTVAHQNLMGDVWLALRAGCPDAFVVSMDQSMRVNRRNEPRPDVVAGRAEHYGRTPVPVEDAVLAVEITSGRRPGRRSLRPWPGMCAAWCCPTTKCATCGSSTTG